MSEWPIPEGAPDGSILAVPTDGRPLYRLLRSREGRVTKDDFQPRLGKGVAQVQGLPELRRVSCSHYLSREEAEVRNTKGSRIGRVLLEPGNGHMARTGPFDGHMDVWARVQDFVDGAEIED